MPRLLRAFARLLPGLALALAALAPAGQGAAGPAVTVRVEGVTPAVLQGRLEGGQVHVPVRALAEALGAEVRAIGRFVVIHRDLDRLEARLRARAGAAGGAFVDYEGIAGYQYDTAHGLRRQPRPGVYYQDEERRIAPPDHCGAWCQPGPRAIHVEAERLAVTVRLMPDGRAEAPLRPLSAALGASVAWDAAARTVVVRDAARPVQAALEVDGRAAGEVAVIADGRRILIPVLDVLRAAGLPATGDGSRVTLAAPGGGAYAWTAGSPVLALPATGTAAAGALQTVLARPARQVDGTLFAAVAAAGGGPAPAWLRVRWDAGGRRLEVGVDRGVWETMGTIVQTLEIEAGGNAVLRARNAGAAPVTLRFRDGQAFDARVLRGGSEVWRWSRGRLFTQALWERTLQPGESWELRFDLPGLPAGAYTVEAWLVAEDLRAAPARAEWLVR